MCIEEPTSPLHPTFTSKAMEKLQWWLDREEHGDQQLKEDFDRRREQESCLSEASVSFDRQEVGVRKIYIARSIFCYVM